MKACQPLFPIDSAPYQAIGASARAVLARAQANPMQASAQAGRYKPLLEANAISKQDYVNAVAAQKTAKADVAAARATVQTAQINLGYASITAPIAGRIGRALVTEGALVGQGEATPLVVQQIDPMYVNFTKSTIEVLRLRKGLASGKLEQAGAGATSVHVMLEDGSEYARAGKLPFSDLTVDPTLGEITLRAELPNPRGLLLPGMYVRVRLSQAELPSAIPACKCRRRRSKRWRGEMRRICSRTGRDGCAAAASVDPGAGRQRFLVSIAKMTVIVIFKA